MKNLSCSLLLVAAFLGIGCGEPTPLPVDDAAIDRTDAGPIVTEDAATPIDAPTTTFPAVCQALPLTCPDADSLFYCEQESFMSFPPCSYLPITFGCEASGCPSRAQSCRTADRAEGYCTHACVRPEDCTVAGSGTASCTEVAPGLSICIPD